MIDGKKRQFLASFCRASFSSFSEPFIETRATIQTRIYHCQIVGNPEALARTGSAWITSRLPVI